MDEPSVPVQNVQLESVGSQECLVSQECVVSEAPSAEVAQSDVLYLSSGDGLEKLASFFFFFFFFLSLVNISLKGGAPPPPQYRVIQLWVVLVSLVLLRPNLWGSLPPLRVFFYLTLFNQFSDSPQRLCLAKPLIIGLSPAIVGYRSWSRQLLPLVRRSARFAMGGFVPLNRSLTRLHPSPGIWRMRSSRLLCFMGRVAPLLHSLGFRHLPSVSLLPRLSSQVLLIQKATLRPLVHLGDGPTTHLRVQLDILLARGVILLPVRGVGSWMIRLPMRSLTLADNGTISRMTRAIFVLLCSLFCWTTSPRSFQLPPSP